ncbi:MAG: SIMPL domain-containing protein, partial [Candidatus Moranbacteria bacterium]|nr:SIMPL domain-containing protein [Candidatus Moranbacteria bacterium]
DLKTLQYNLSPRYDYAPCVAGSCPAPSISGYSLTQTLEVKVRDSAKLGDLLSGVVRSGANSVSEVRFTVDDDTAAKDEARAEAIAEAKKKAKATAKAAGFRLGKLVTLYENSNPMPYYGMGGGGADMYAAKAEAAPVVEPGTQSTKVQVTLTYEVKD